MDLLLISAGHDEKSLAGAWFYVPRMLHARSHVYVESRAADGSAWWRRMPAAEVAALAGASRRRRAA
jgi:hypothetical protein